MSRSAPRRAACPQLIGTFRRTRAVAIQWIVVAVTGFFAFAYVFGHVLAAIRGTTLEPILIPVFAPSDAIVWLVAAGALVALVVVPHELLHGVFMARYGSGDPEYGIGVSYFLLPYAYAETEGASYTRNQLLVALLAPFVGITAVGLVAMVVYPSPLLIVPLAANAAGSIGDLWMASVLLQYPADVRVGPLPGTDTQGFGVYRSGSRTGRRRPGTRVLSRLVAGAVGTGTVLAIVIAGTVFGSLVVGSGTVVIDVPGSDWLLFRHELYPHAGTVLLEINGWLAVAIAVAGGLAWALLTTGYRTIGRE
ncbi:DUF3267 domain-containing protein [Natronolimnohabitans sp. A-GB9]|uniref:DUF3267 domain-containing protein n=1 Tax=Natronolimnohabitans sp. A-GB9 TaxID=3069757 RepID=UPI0027B7E887|nr:DUF3267 domain-containing protein [Natronolimnohabitans sp. A-GB9]MDQ2051457.1 DUF3267 domain-containing protein [Natronolimnohabitans sp. A-GB9]